MIVFPSLISPTAYAPWLVDTTIATLETTLGADLVDRSFAATHLPTFFAAVVFFVLVHAASAACALAVPSLRRVYTRLDSTSEFDTRVVSTVHAVVAVAGVARFFAGGERSAADTLWTRYDTVANVTAFTAGYFVVDTLSCIVFIRTFGAVFIAHGAVAFVIFFTCSVRPYLQLYAAIFLLYEATNPFVNVHWFLTQFAPRAKLAMMANGVALWLSYTVCRMLLGVVASVWLGADIYADLAPRVAAGTATRVHVVLNVYYMVSTAFLCGLNCMWYSMICRGMLEELGVIARRQATTTTTTTTTKKKSRKSQ